MIKKIIFSFILSMLLSTSMFAQEAIVELEDDTLPIAPTRYDDAVEPPKDNFSSAGKQDMWEKFERGELDEKAFIKLQEDYQMQASQSKDPVVRRKIASDMKEKRKENLLKKKEEKALKVAEEKKIKKKAEANKFDNEINMMAKEKELAQKKATEESKAQALANAKANEKLKAKTKVVSKTLPSKRAPASIKKTKKNKK